MEIPSPAALQPWFSVLLFGAIMARVWQRSIFYRRFVGVALGVLCFVWWALSMRLPDWLGWVSLLLQMLTAMHFVRLVRARLHGPLYRATLTIPALWFAASSVLALPFAIASVVGFSNDGFYAAYLIGLFGVAQSLWGQPETQVLDLDRLDRGSLAPAPELIGSRRAIERLGRTTVPEPTRLRIVQITDPHLGPFMSPAQLAAICRRAVDADPDLVLITGDLLTMESHGAVDDVAAAFAPLRALRGRVFACHGNHDHEDRCTVREGLERAGARLLVDEWVRVRTRAGAVDVIGADFHWRNREKKLRHLFVDHADDGTPRVLLLHHPGHIADVPEGSADLVLSGHTHGGHVGLLSLGASWTVVRGFTSMPDHGLWVRGRDRIYVHRGTGHYGFPLRLGVPREESLLQVSFRNASALPG